jgi:outer membrane lipoprotein-sorting protein
MKFFCTYTLLLCLISCAFAPARKTNDESAYEVVKLMFAKTKRITGVTYTMNKLERVGDEITEQKSSVKLNRTPIKVYSKQHAPKAGIEVLYVNGAHSGMALVNPNGFPWVTLKLDPMGSTMRKKQHHTIKDSGYDLVVSILEHLTQKYQSSLPSMISNKGTVMWDGHACWSIEFNNNFFKRTQYAVKAKETVLSIAQRNRLSEYMLMEENDLDDYSDVPVGTVLNLPNDYASKMTLLIDKTRHIPLVMKVYDDKGLYEQYEYTNVVLDPAFHSEEFDSDFDDYNF